MASAMVTGPKSRLLPGLIFFLFQTNFIEQVHPLTQLTNHENFPSLVQLDSDVGVHSVQRQRSRIKSRLRSRDDDMSIDESAEMELKELAHHEIVSEKIV
jgi:hypothetical protein